MSVSKIFKVLIVIVACVMIGALILNVFLPNVVTSLSNAVEGSIYNATGMSFDLNGDGKAGRSTGTTIQTGNVAGAGAQTNNASGDEDISADVQGFN